MILQGQVGPQSQSTSLAPASTPNLRLGNMGELIASQLHGGYYEAAYRRVLFSAANQSLATTTVGLAATYTGLAISNPPGSQINISIISAAAAFIVAFPAGAVVGIMAGYNASTAVTHTTPATPRNMHFGLAAVGLGQADVACTFPTAPVLTHVMGSGHTGAINTMTMTQMQLDLRGSLLLPPGGYAAIYTSTVSGTSGFMGSIVWEEIPL